MTVGDVLRLLRRARGCGGREAAAWLVTGPTVNQQVRPRGLALLVPDLKSNAKLVASLVIVVAVVAPFQSTCGHGCEHNCEATHVRCAVHFRVEQAGPKQYIGLLWSGCARSSSRISTLGTSHRSRKPAISQAPDDRRRNDRSGPARAAQQPAEARRGGRRLSRRPQLQIR